MPADKKPTELNCRSVLRTNPQETFTSFYMASQSNMKMQMPTEHHLENLPLIQLRLSFWDRVMITDAVYKVYSILFLFISFLHVN